MESVATARVGKPGQEPGDATLPAARIVAIRATPLFGESPEGGWSQEIKAEDSIHALIAVHTDAGGHRLW